MTPSPRLLLSIDYESWFSLSRRYDFITPEERLAMDGGYARDAINPILDFLGDSKISFYLVGELVEWYPQLPKKIINAGHEVGFHCHVHRVLNEYAEIERDLNASANWRKKYGVSGYRAPMIRIIEEAYPLLEKHNIEYSSSIYAPAGTFLIKGNIHEIPASTLALRKTPADFRAPRYITPSLLLSGELPYSSGMMSGLFTKTVFKIIENEMKKGLSPVIFLHPYEIVAPEHFVRRFASDLILNPLLYPFTLNKSTFLKNLLKNFPTSTMRDFIKEKTATL